jgi:hypothetical protein
MYRRFWIIGGVLVLLVLIGGLVAIALSARMNAYRPTSLESSTPSTGIPPASAPTATAAILAAPSPQPDPTARPTPAPAAPTSSNLADTTVVAFAGGEQAITRPPLARDLWTAQASGERVFARPRLYGGALVTVLEIAVGAVRVRTPEGVDGWIHEPVEEALTEDLTMPGAQAGFVVGARVRIVWPNGIPLRAQPAPDALKVLPRLAPGQLGSVQELRGDWLLISLDDGTTGWARWYYDDQIYIATTGVGVLPTAVDASGFQVAGVRVGIGDGQRVRVVVDLARVGASAPTTALWDAPAPQLISTTVNVRVRAQASGAPAVKYLATRAQELAEVTAIATADGVELQIAPQTPLYFRAPFFLPRDAPDSSSEYDRVVVDLCFAADCPALR